MTNPFRRVRAIADWLDDRDAERHGRRLREFYVPLIAAAEKAKDWDQHQSLLSEWDFEAHLVFDPVYARKAERLTNQARRYGITIPPMVALGQGNDYWETSTATGDRVLTRKFEEQLRRDIRAERRASYDEARKWATLAFAVAGTVLAGYSVSIKEKKPDPCAQNYYRSDSGECVFGKAVPPPSQVIVSPKPAIVSNEKNTTAKRRRSGIRPEPSKSMDPQ